ncbi:hypothetical protein D3P09_14225 [Paenibacillus pinisoli]|uniref:Uncharacterized protein n=1 Tax=Paenibacillus pinisoli TaxID=1276110 RepID=A0A3A6PI35_9BACL|nr:hypothetical protein D3P09_14225 [Paenibacillus pinisoli]
MLWQSLFLGFLLSDQPIAKEQEQKGRTIKKQELTNVMSNYLASGIARAHLNRGHNGKNGIQDTEYE